MILLEAEVCSTSLLLQYSVWLYCNIFIILMAHGHLDCNILGYDEKRACLCKQMLKLGLAESESIILMSSTQ